MHAKLLLGWVIAGLSGALAAMPVHAAPLRERVFVASFGTDTGNMTCSFAQPCRTFQNAVNNVAVSGEVVAIDTAGFGPISITQSVTVSAPHGIEAGVSPAAGADAININAPGATVRLRGLTLIGAGTANNGIALTGASRFEVIDCTISDFTGAGIEVNSATAISVLISDTTVTEISGAYGIVFFSSNAGVSATLDRVTASGDQQAINAISGNSPIELLVTNSHIDHNAFAFVTGAALSAPVDVILENVALNDDTVALNAGGLASFWLSRVLQTSVSGFATTAIQFTGPGNHVFSDGTNHLGGAGTNLLSSWPAN